DGVIRRVADEYVADDETDADVQWHAGIDFLSRNERWIVTSLPFTTPVAGTVHVFPNSPWNTVAVILANGDQLSFLHASELSVHTGDQVQAGAVIGKTGHVGTDTIHLHLQARDARGTVASPDLIVDRARAVG